MKKSIIIALLSLALLPVANAGLADTAKKAVKVTPPSASVDAGGVKVTKPNVEVARPSLPEVKKPELPAVKKPQVEVTHPSATVDENGINIVKPDVKLK